MATPIQDFKLDHQIFNQGFYSSIRDFWFRGVEPNDTAAKSEVIMRWFAGGSPESKVAFDKECADLTGAALKSISPDKLALPPFQSHEDERQKADLLSAPLFAEVAKAEHSSDTLLSLLLLLDQMPRNIFREVSELPIVYDHYDRLGLALLRTSLKQMPNPLGPYRGKPVFTIWFYLPLIHSEDLEAHELWQTVTEAERVLLDKDDVGAQRIISSSKESEAKHVEPLVKFGRYPHRNQCLGRDHTADEEKYLESADTFGVKQNPKTTKGDETAKNEL